jgi:hypothetical protein
MLAIRSHLNILEKKSRSKPVNSNNISFQSDNIERLAARTGKGPRHIRTQCPKGTTMPQWAHCDVTQSSESDTYKWQP